MEPVLYFQEHFQKLRIENSMGSSAATSKQVPHEHYLNKSGLYIIFTLFSIRVFIEFMNKRVIIL